MPRKNNLHTSIPDHKLGTVGDPELQLKLLNRFRKIFLSKQRMLEVRKDGDVTVDLVNSFKQLLNVKGILKKKDEFDRIISGLDEDEEQEDSLEKIEDKFTDEIRKIWFDLTDRESFRAEADQLLRTLPLDKAQEVKENIASFEKEFSNVNNGLDKYLYYTRHTDGILKSRNIEINRYSSLRRLIKNNAPQIGGRDTKKGIEDLKKFIEDLFIKEETSFIFKDIPNDKKGINKDDAKKYTVEDENVYKDDISDLTQFIIDNSDEYKRKILNAYFSEIIDVEPSDEVPFVKRRGGGIDYSAFRILVWLRNKNFNFSDFIHFLHNLNPEDLPERMLIDLGLGGIVKTFITQVKDPKKVDHLIMTHRIVKGLWQNGSKFLNSYTLHNEDHAIKLINESMEIVRRIDYLQLKTLDYYILFLACYLHDISMVIHPNLQMFCHADEKNIIIMESYISEMKDVLDNQEKALKNHAELLNFWKQTGAFMLSCFNEVYGYFESDVRDSHAESSANFVIDKRNDLFNYLDETIISNVARAGRDHSKPEYHIYDVASDARKDAISVKYISIILRLADLMDVSNDRVNYHLLHENVKHLSSISRFHWISHLITDEIKLIPKYSLEKRNIPKEKLLGKDNSIYPPYAYYIKENLRFYIILNVKSLEPIDIGPNNFMCKGWCKGSYDDSVCPSRYKGYDGITIIFPDFDTNVTYGKENNIESKCAQKYCPMICYWMVKKHEWVFKELVKLKKYLNVINHHPFETDIEVNILFKNLYNIENYLYDDVRRFLKGEHNE